MKQKLYMLFVYFTLLLVILATARCGKVHRYEHPQEVSQYVQWAEKHFSYDASVIDIKFVDEFPSKPSGKVVGNCNMNIGVVSLLRSYWDNTSEHYRQMLIIHELGHCLQQLQHDNTIENGCPKSYMYPILDVLTVACESNYL